MVRVTFVMVRGLSGSRPFWSARQAAKSLSLIHIYVIFSIRLEVARFRLRDGAPGNDKLFGGGRLQPLVDVPRGFLRGALLAVAFGLPHPFAAHTRLHRKCLGVLGSALAHDHITRRRQVARLRELLQLSLIHI